MESASTTITRWCEAHDYGPAVRIETLSGGAVSRIARLHTERGASFILKHYPDAPPNLFSCEVAGLKALEQPGGPRIPSVALSGPDFLLLEDLTPAAPAPDFWKTFGHQLAALHRTTTDCFGFDHDNYCGITPQPNPWTENGYAFFAEHRLLYQSSLALQNGLIEADDQRRIEFLCAILPDLIPPQPPALIHGDLWNGNALAGPNGEPCLIDPAAHYGWAEAELGLTALFGGFPSAFYDAYAEASPLASEWEERLDIYNLYHLLNHLNFFGASYRPRTRAVLYRYT